ncbi:MAG TPA: N-acetylmannosamine-6-phosphate 2-epimerase [Caldilineaceae bacterium]|nr:N-acetylmannosamine-6-phosphate 2-epimerase [Caldilineaceae bacterium]
MMLTPHPEHTSETLANELAARTAKFVAQVRGGLIVSCQALADEPLHGAEIMARMARAAQMGGARAIRANSPPDIRAIVAAVDLPVIGLYKEELPDYPVYITPTVDHAKAVAEAGAHIIAIDATARPRPEPADLKTLIATIHQETGRPVLADVSTLEEGLAAEAAGADLVATTLSGYTDYSPQQREPDLELTAALARRLEVPLLAEGRYHTPEQAAAALAAGALAVVVGGAITRPQEIARRFVEAINQAAQFG